MGGCSRRSWTLAGLVSLAAVGTGCGSNGNGDTGGGSPPSSEAGADATTGADGSMQFGGDDASGGDDAGPDGSGGGGPNPCVPPTSLTISPGTEADTVSTGTAFSRTFTATANYANNTTADVTSQTYFSLGS